MIGRLLKPLYNKSFFLFGARGTGKSTLLDGIYNPENSFRFDLLDPVLLDDLRLDRERFKRTIDTEDNRNRTIIVDEVQRLPDLLNYVHQSIHKEKRVFALTGSSARRLKQLGTNLLAGRALVYYLFPLTSVEIGPNFDLQKALEFGLLPDCYLAESEQLATEILRAYILTYVEKEIQIEQWVRKIEPFRNFLGIAAQMNGKIINRSAIARDVGVDDTTVADYYEILEDTLLGISLPAFHRSARKRQRKSNKFFLIDMGVKRALDRTLVSRLVQGTSAYGEAFEHFLFLEIYKLASYARKDWRFFYYQTREGYEVDLVIERPGQPLLLVELKSKLKVTAEDCAVIERIAPEIDPTAERVLLSLDKTSQSFGKTSAMHWQEFLDKTFSFGK
jgi:predicted AAA+ superfamily ATPase